MEQVIALAVILGVAAVIAFIVWPKEVAHEEPSPAEKKTSTKKSKAKAKVDLTTLKKAELKDLCAKQGIAVKANDTKAVLIQKLES